MSLPGIQIYVTSMCESIGHMKLTPAKKEFAKAVMRAAIDYANAQHGMHSSADAKAAAMSPAHREAES
jgi:hypothetical protein